jgi:phosphoglycerol transferase MdoB-like AlkP superfamily enzyme
VSAFTATGAAEARSSFCRRAILAALFGRHTRFVAAVFLVVSGVATGAAGLQTPTLDLEILDQEVPPVVESGGAYSVSVVVTNNGTVSWFSDDGFFLSYHWLNEAGDAVVWDGLRTAFETPVHAGDSASLVAAIEAPRSPGRYSLVWDVVREGEFWVSEVDPTPVASASVDVVVGSAFSILADRSPRVMVVGGEVSVRLAVRNDGARAWPAGNAVALSYHWLDRDGSMAIREGRRGAVPVLVNPGETAEMEIVLVAPDQPGAYRLQWDMVEEGVAWFSDRTNVPPPSQAVLVVIDVFSDPVWWAVFSLLTAAVAVSIGGRSGRPFLASAVAVADVFWCAGSLVVKQGFVLAAAGSPATVHGRVLMAGSAAAIALILVMLPGRWRQWSVWSVAAAGAFLVWGDALYQRFFGDFPGPEALAGAGQLGRVEASVFSLMELRDLWLFVDLLPGLVLVMAASHAARRVGPRPRRVAAAALAVVVAAGVVAGVRLGDAQPGLLDQVFRRTRVAQEIGVFNLHAVDLAERLASEILVREISSDEFDEISTWFQSRAPMRAGAGPAFGAAKGFNLIMIQVESLQGFVIGLEVEGSEVTPFLNRWAEDGLWFSNVTDQTAQGRSSDSELATQVSLLPFSGGAAAFRFADSDYTGLAEILSGRGYTTLSAVPYDGSFWNRRSTHAAYGYAESLFAGDFAAGEAIGWGLSDRDFLDQAGRKLAAVEQPFAAYLLTLSLHHPFAGFPKHLEVLDVGRWQGTPFGNFLHTMHFFDASLASFVAGLERSGLAASTVIAVWGDHDAGFPWRPEIAAVAGESHDPEGWYLSQEVPLLIRVPGAPDLRGERTTVAGHVDVAPTLLALLGVDPAPYAFVGRNLLGTPGDPPVVGEYGCWRDSRLLYLQGDGALVDGVCIDLSSRGRVPAESCADGFAATQTLTEVSDGVLRHDLQNRLHREMAGRGTDAP